MPAGQNIETALEKEARIPLNPLKEGGVLRVTLLEPGLNGRQEAFLALTLHVLAGAEPSMQLLQDHVLAAYENAKSGIAASIKPGLQFRDVLHWLSQRQNKGVQPPALRLHMLPPYRLQQISATLFTTLQAPSRCPGYVLGT